MWAGFDTEKYPGEDAMQWLWDNTNLYWCGYYLAPAPSHPDTSWRKKRGYLKYLGWGIAPIYVGQQDRGRGQRFPSTHQGKIDGKKAADLARNGGFRDASILYLDIELPPPAPPHNKPMIDYYRAWVLAVIDGGFWPGVYCSPLRAPQLVAANPAPIVPVIWAAHWHDQFGTYQNPYPDESPAKSGYPLAKVWQHAGDAKIRGPHGNLRVDLSSCYTNDPSNIQVSLSSA